MISCSHILHLLLVDFLVEGSRGKNTARFTKAVALELFCYLSDAINEVSCSVYLSFHDFREKVVSKWNDSARELIDGLFLASVQRSVGIIG